MGNKTAVVLSVVAVLFGGASIFVARDTRSTRESLPSPYDVVLSNVDFENLPLGTALEDLGRSAQINIATDWHSLGYSKITKETPITLHLRNIKFLDALRALLNQLPLPRGGFLVYRDLVLVNGGFSFPEDESLLEAHVYDVQDLLDLEGDGPPPIHSAGLPDDSERFARMEYLIGLLQWDRPRGMTGWEGRLFVIATPDQHDEVRKWLDVLRRGALAGRSLKRPTTRPAHRHLID